MLTIYLYDLPPMPRNRSHMLTVIKGRPMNIKTALCREFEKDLEQRLISQIDPSQLAIFRMSFYPDENYIKAIYTIYTPESELFTIKKTISSRSVDTDAHKCMRDCVYEYLGLDDKIERDTRFFTPVSTDGKWNYKIELEIEDKENLYV